MTSPATNTFAELGLSPEILCAIERCGYREPTPIQRLAVPHILAGKDVFGAAQTGTGKTAAFVWPMLMKLAGDAAQTLCHPRGGGDPSSTSQKTNLDSRLRGNDVRGASSHGPRALILEPTRELAVQVWESVERYRGNLPIAAELVIGGMDNEAQRNALRRGCDVIVATPGRLYDHVFNGDVTLEHVEFAVLDEADRMLELGFYTSTRRLLRACVPGHQILFFSATLVPEVETWAKELLNDPVRVEAAPASTLVVTMKERGFRVLPRAKHVVLLEILNATMDGISRHPRAGGDPSSTGHKTNMDSRLRGNDASSGNASPSQDTRTLVFVRTRERAAAVAKFLTDADLPATAIHGEMRQRDRTAAIEGFKSGKIATLVATDVAARGLDIPDVHLVVNLDMPPDPVDYVHRAGRTARIGKDGEVISLVADHEVPMVKAVESLTGRTIPLGSAPEHGSTDAYPPLPDVDVRASASKPRKKSHGGTSRATHKKSAKPRKFSGSEQSKRNARAARKRSPVTSKSKLKVRRSHKRGR
ncbi:MAG: DEAD/DEAH box helicase [Planctomycetaceae bacterium]|nr:DEAD/DEAH box helicase [Planctomycetaceae bacterium]